MKVEFEDEKKLPVVFKGKISVINIIKKAINNPDWFEGIFDGLPDGWPDGWPDGCIVGFLIGWFVGCDVGKLVGCLDGLQIGW